MIIVGIRDLGITVVDGNMITIFQSFFRKVSLRATTLLLT